MQARNKPTKKLGLKKPKDPYPGGTEIEVDSFQYLDELHLVRHAKAPPTAKHSKWQVSKDYRVRFDVHTKNGSWTQELVVPRGLYNDLASVPELLWSLIGPIGPHLEASVVHDYLYMAWTDFRPKNARRVDHEFADKVFLAGMRKASNLKRWRRAAIYRAVRWFGWNTFSDKNWQLRDRMTVWLKDLQPDHVRRRATKKGAAGGKRAGRKERVRRGGA